MDYVPFMLFLMVCLMGFCGSMARSYEIVPVGVWPAWCAKRTYCFDRPADYPTPEKIQELYKKTIENASLLMSCPICEVGKFRENLSEIPWYNQGDVQDVDLSKLKQPPYDADDRIAVNECKIYRMIETIYMIKDENDRIRYVLQDISIFLFRTEVEECKPDQDLEEYDDSLACRQKYQDIQFPVLSLDKTRVELTNIKRGLPVSCRLVKLTTEF